MSDLSRLLSRYQELPVASILPELAKALDRGNVVLTAPTGSGKTTLVPPALLARDRQHGAIIMLEPRRIAARAAARRIAAMLGEEAGMTVGYRTRLESKVSCATRIEVVTEGILIRRLQTDPELTGVGLVIFDEFHERNLLSDLGLALCLDLCELRDDLRLLVMSATLQTDRVCPLLGDAVHIEAEGRSYPVTIHHLPQPADTFDIAVQTASGVRTAWREQQGDILAFLPGAGEIHRCRDLLADTLPEATLLPLYGNLSSQEQDRVFVRDAGDTRRIILATPIAETSLTIDKIGCVVDSGWYRRPIYDSGSGMARLATLRISRASADQRTGRAGRTGPGACYRLWSKETEYSLLPATPPEMSGADLAPLVLELALWGVTDPNQMRWLDAPRASQWQGGVALLQRLNLLRPDGNLTDRGRRVAALPLHPRLAVMLLGAEQLGLPRTGCLLAALLAERDILKGRGNSADLEYRLRLLAGQERDPRCDAGVLRHLLQQARQWQELLSGRPEPEIRYREAGTILAFGFPDRIGLLRDGSRHRYQLASGKGVELAADDPLGGTRLLVCPQVDNRQGDGRIFLATALDRRELEEHPARLIMEAEEVDWNEAEGRVSVSRQRRVGRIVLESRPLASPDPGAVLAALMTGIRQAGPACLPKSRECRELQARVCSLHHWFPREWPDWSDAALFADLSWLEPYCHDFRSLDHLRSLDVATILSARLDWPRRQKLDSLAPSHLQVPSGSRIRLSYKPGEAPVLAVRLQELFGLQHTPAICQGRVPVLLHLLSPARRPLQVTADLRSFWLNTYSEVRKELAGRYPKHYWPEDPFTATPTAKTKKQLERQR